MKMHSLKLAGEAKIQDILCLTSLVVAMPYIHIPTIPQASYCIGNLFAIRSKGISLFVFILFLLFSICVSLSVFLMVFCLFLH